jgi:acyl phosphate:glycerol-3-phosphate acyltransferase
MLELGVKVLMGYLLGSIVGALAIGQLRGVDIRTMGSGNAGGTNALRTQGFGFAAGTVFIDVGKGWVAAGWLPAFAIPGVVADPVIGRDWLAVSCAAAAVAGHVWPLWHDFRGGKGGATLAGVLLALAPLLLAIAAGAWLVVVTLSGFVGLATVAAAASVPIAVWAGARESIPLLALGVAIAALVAWAHRGNLARIRSGTEPHADKVWLLRPRKAP